jgi:hypothetical protein
MSSAMADVVSRESLILAAREVIVLVVVVAVLIWIGLHLARRH